MTIQVRGDRRIFCRRASRLAVVAGDGRSRAGAVPVLEAHLDAATHPLHQAGLQTGREYVSKTVRHELAGGTLTLRAEVDARPSLSFSIRAFSAAARSS